MVFVFVYLLDETNYISCFFRKAIISYQRNKIFRYCELFQIFSKALSSSGNLDFWILFKHANVCGKCVHLIYGSEPNRSSKFEPQVFYVFSHGFTSF
jgi:hypothetical protein